MRVPPGSALPGDFTLSVTMNVLFVWIFRELHNPRVLISEKPANVTVLFSGNVKG